MVIYCNWTGSKYISMTWSNISVVHFEGKFEAPQKIPRILCISNSYRECYQNRIVIKLTLLHCRWDVILQLVRYFCRGQTVYIFTSEVKTMWKNSTAFCKIMLENGMLVQNTTYLTKIYVKKIKIMDYNEYIM